ncbi:FtsX-like permease family protein [Kitasatospora sp. NPDC088134]|uniref:FtsX-like permease family protein n=1 Tax=Kitasatospora sp. NPDC088134 TaxID=3364071 RepID=UPI00382C8836
MLTLALANLRSRWTAFVGTFVALALGTGLISMMALVLAATLGTPHPAPQRFAAATAVAVPVDARGEAARLPAGLPAALLAEAPSGAVADRTFPARWPGGPSDGVGHGWSSAALTPYHLTAGRAPAADDEIVLTGGAELVGRRIDLATAAGRSAYTVVGATEQRWFEHAAFLTDSAAARISPPVNALAATGPAGPLPSADGVLLLTGPDRRQADPDPSGGADQLLNAQAMAATTSGIAVTVAVFIVIATFAFSVEQRGRELALLRLTGATPRQVAGLVLAEAGLVGLAGSAVGAVLGVFGAGALRGWMVGHGVAPDWFGIGVDPLALLAAVLLGLASALLGAAAVAVRAARVRPVAALRDSAANTRAMTPLRWVLALGLLAGAVATGWTITSTSPEYAVNARKYGTVPLLFVGGLALLAPVLLRPAARLATWPLGRLGAGALIVRQNTLNARRRTAATVTPVVVAVGLVAAMVSMQAAGDRARVELARGRTGAAAVVLPEDGGLLDRPTVAALADLRATTVTPTRIEITGADGTVLDSLTGQAVPPGALGSLLTPTVVAGSLTGLGDDFLVVDEHTARSDDLSVGQTVGCRLPDGSRTELRIAAVVRTGLSGDDTYLAAAHAAGGLPALAWLGTPADAAAARAALDGRTALVGPADRYFDRLAAKQRAQSRNASVVVLGISVGYALLSVANTLVMAAAGRRRELAALNLAGATRAHVLRLIAAESVLAVLVGSLLAAVAGAAVAATQATALRRLVGGFAVTVPWTAVAQATALCAAVAVTAAVLSAWRTTRGRAIEAAGARE